MPPRRARSPTASSAVGKQRRAPTASAPANLLSVAHRKGFAIRPAGGDGAPLTRADLQYDLLAGIFGDDKLVFSDPLQTLHGDPPGTKVTFRDLYVNALLNSSRSSKVLKERMHDHPGFATDFAKLALLVNVGRVNTTMCFVPEMRTNLRAYHPLPALQTHDTGGSMQDAPRIKNILKAGLLESEMAAPPCTPADITTLGRSGRQCGVFNLIFVMANHSAPIAHTHFPPLPPNSPTYDFLDLFTPIALSSACRARTFLWLCYHYLEASRSTAPNPYATAEANSASRGGVQGPPFVVLTADELALENVDTEQEKIWGDEMMRKRKTFKERLAASGGAGVDDAEVGSAMGDASSVVDSASMAGEEAENAPFATSISADLGQPSQSRRGRGRARGSGDSVRARGRRKARPEGEPHPLRDERHFDDDGAQPPKPKRQRQSYRGYTPPEPYRMSYSNLNGTAAYRPEPHVARRGGYSSRQTEVPGTYPGRLYYSAFVDSAEDPSDPEPAQPTSFEPHVFNKSMLQHAWEVVGTTDPLADSDDEGGDENVRLDLMRRIDILSRLQHKMVAQPSHGRGPERAVTPL